MMNVLNAVAVTLLVAVVSVLPAALVGQYLPGVFDPGLRPIAVAAWISGLISWYVSREITRKQQEAVQEAVKQTSGGKGVAVTVVFLVAAVGVIAALHFFGDGLLG